MVGPVRGVAIGWGVWALLAAAGVGRAQDAAPPAPLPPDGAQAKARDRLTPGDFGLPGEDPPRAFVPARPRTVEEQKRIDALRDYVEARAFEERKEFGAAIRQLDRALANDPDSVAALRRLARIHFALGRDDKAVEYSRRVVAIEPGDVATLELLVKHAQDDPAVAEAILKEVAANPKLDRDSMPALFVQYQLGTLYEATLRFDHAAEAFARVMEALDEPPARRRISPADLRRFLGAEEAQGYLRFGRVFLQARKADLAIRAFRHGLDYDPDSPLLLLFLAQTYQASGRAAEALAMIERFLARQPSGREPYDFLVKLLTDLHREDEIIPRLEKYAAANPRNVALQFALAERYRAAGQGAKAQAILAAQLDNQRDTQGFTETFAKLLKERNADELALLLVRVWTRVRRVELIQGQIDQLLADPALTDAVLDAGLRMLSAEPPAIDPQQGWLVLRNLANEGKRLDRKAAVLRWALQRMPSPPIYNDLFETLGDQEKYGEAEEVQLDFFRKFPDERTIRNLYALAIVQVKAERFEAAAATLREALQQAPNNPGLIQELGRVIVQAGRDDEAVALARDALAGNANNPDLIVALGFILMQVGKNDEAIAQFRTLIERFPDDDHQRKGRSALSNIYTDMGDFARGEAELEAYYNHHPDDAGINNDLGYLYADQGKNLDKAEGMIRKALAEEPENYAYLDSLGWVLFKRGKYQEARGPLERANAAPEADATIPEHLGDVYLQLREPAKARAAFEKAVKLATKARPVDKRLGEIRKKLDTLREIEAAPRPRTGDNP